MSGEYNRGIPRAIPIDPENTRIFHNAEVHPVINGTRINERLKTHAIVSRVVYAK